MKFGLLDFDLTVQFYWDHAWNRKALLNIGDAAEYLVVEQLYRSLGIEEGQMKRLSIADLTGYRGESLIVALNIALDSYVGYNNLLENLSPDIIPIFLGMSFTDPQLNQRQIECLKKYAPIGCRDERSYLCMQSYGIPCYLNGCTASVLQIEEEAAPEFADKILLIDVPYGVLKHIPEELKPDMRFLNQEMYCKRSELGDDFKPSDWARRILSCYHSKPRMIVTSRFHGAVLALAEKVPAIITLEKYTFRFSWLQNYFPVYTEKTFDEIDWWPSVVDYDAVAKRILEVSKKRISETIKQYRSLLVLTDLQRTLDPSGEKESSNQVLYYRKTWEDIQRIWDPQKEYQYGFWGVNDNTKMLFQLISEKYPQAHLVDVYDMFKEVSFEGIPSTHPRELKKHASQNNYFVISTAYLASRVVRDICDDIKFPEERIFLCTRDFIVPGDI